MILTRSCDKAVDNGRIIAFKSFLYLKITTLNENFFQSKEVNFSV